MNTEKFINEIQKYIDAKVEECVLKERSILIKSIKHIIKNNTSTISENSIKSKKSLLDITDLDDTIEEKNNNTMFTNGAFSSLLNETAERGEWRNINSNGVFTSNDALSFGVLNNRSSMEMGHTGKISVPTTDSDGRPVNLSNLTNTDAGTAVIKALNKDYSSLLKRSKEMKSGV